MPNKMDYRTGRRLEHRILGFADRVRRAFEARAPAPRHDQANGSSGYTDLRRAFEARAPAPRHDLANGSSGFTDLRRAFEAGAARRVPNKSGKSAHRAYIVGAAVAVAAALAAPVSVALFIGSRGGSDQGTERREVFERKSPPSSVATTDPASPSSAADAEPPDTDPNAIPGTTARAKVPTRPFPNLSDSGQVSPGSPSPSGAPAPPAPAPPPVPPAPTDPPDPTDPPSPTFPPLPDLPAP